MDNYRKKLYVGNINFRTEPDSLKAFIESHGFDVEEILIITDKVTTRSKGFGFVTLKDENDLETAVGVLNQMSLDGRSLKVNVATPPEPRQRVQSI